MLKPPIDNSDLIFDEKTHKYSFKSKPGVKLTSATTFIGKFFKPFNGPKIAAKLIDTHEKYANYTVKELLQEWNKSSTHGTRVHNEIENFILNSFDDDELSERKAFFAAEWLKKTFDLDNHILYPEVRMASSKYGLSGTIDLLAYDPKTDTYIIGDWKTNKKITTYPYNYQKGIKNSTKHLDDTKAVKYGLQMSLYRFLLENEYGLKVKKQILIHLKPTDIDLYFTPYYEQEIQNMIEEYNEWTTTK